MDVMVVAVVVVGLKVVVVMRVVVVTVEEVVDNEVDGVVVVGRQQQFPALPLLQYLLPLFSHTSLLASQSCLVCLHVPVEYLLSMQ